MSDCAQQLAHFRDLPFELSPYVAAKLGVFHQLGVTPFTFSLHLWMRNTSGHSPQHRDRKRTERKTQNLTPKIFMVYLQASGHQRRNSTLLIFLKCLFPRAIPALLLWLCLLSLCQHYLFPLRLGRWHDWSPPSTGTADPSLSLWCPCLPGGWGTIAVYGCRHGVCRDLREKVLTHCILQGRDRHFPGLQRLEVPLHSCRPRTACGLTALAGAQGVGKRFVQQEAMQVRLVGDSI